MSVVTYTRLHDTGTQFVLQRSHTPHRSSYDKNGIVHFLRELECVSKDEACCTRTIHQILLIRLLKKVHLLSLVSIKSF
jgi:hypothetical protein